MINNTATNDVSSSGCALATAIALLVSAVVGLALVDHTTALSFLQSASPDSKVAGIQFADGVTFFKNLHGGFLGLGIPAAVCALTATGLLWLSGSRLAKTFANCVVGGVLLVLFAPSIIA